MLLHRARICLGFAGTFVVFRLMIAMFTPAQMETHPALLISAIIFLTISILMLLQLGFVVSLAGLKLQAKSAALISAGALCIFVGIIFLLMKARITIPILLGLVLAFKDLSLMLFAASMGYTISFIVREPNIIMPIALFAGLVDYWGVTAGPLSAILASRPEVLDAVSVHMPVPVINAPGTIIGMGDFVFFALFFAVMYRFSLNVKGAFWLGYGLLTLTMFVVMALNIAIPALAPMGVAVIAANVGVVKLRREEKLATLYLGILLLAALVLLKWQIFKSLF